MVSARVSAGGDKAGTGRSLIVGESSSSKRPHISFTVPTTTKRMKDYEEPSSAIAFYANAAASSSNPGIRPEDEDNQEGELEEQDGEQSGEGEENMDEEGEEEEQTSISCILTDSHLLDCPICLKALEPPVYQCNYGQHIACESCYRKMKDKCRSCDKPVWYARNRAFEMVIESILIRCPNLQYGCNESFRYSKRLDHEKTCIYMPFSCPCCCSYSGCCGTLHTHVRDNHSSSYRLISFEEPSIFSPDDIKNRFILVEKNTEIFFVLNRTVQPYGSYGYVICIAPATSDRRFLYSQRRFLYSLEVRHRGSSIKLWSLAENTPLLGAGHKATARLLVDDDFKNAEWELTIYRMESPVRYVKGV